MWRGGIKDGIEKYSKILMPLLLLIIVVIAIRSITLPGSKEGLVFLFKPDFSKITWEAVLKALGQVFFFFEYWHGNINYLWVIYQ